MTQQAAKTLYELSSQPVIDLDAVQKEIRDMLIEYRKDSTTYLKEIAVDDYIDVLDSSKTWRLARVLSREDKFLTVHLVGWPDKYKETHSLITSKIRPPKTESQIDSSHYDGNYTKNSISAIRDILTVSYQNLTL